VSPATDSTLNDPQRIIAALQRQLAERTIERDEALAQQIASGEVLRTISRSTFDLKSVLDALSETAARICEAELAFMTRRDGIAYRFVTAVGSTPKTKSDAIFLKETVLDRQVFTAGRGSITGRVIAEAQALQIPDLAADPEYTLGELVTVGKIRTLLGVPLMRDDEVIGTISLGRQRVEPFTDRQIGLVNTFAAQAVIAMENARLITETREALEQQAATAEVLGVINASAGDLAPVFDAVLEKAHRLCGAAFGGLLVYDGDLFRAAALRNVPEDFVQLARQPFRPGPQNGLTRLVQGAPLVHIADLAIIAAAAPDDAVLSASVEQGGIRTLLLMPLRRDGVLLGAITAYRQHVEAFSDHQIALLRSFAAQAVIAMENARLLNETREALEQQTATADVLEVINASPGDLAPVFDAMLEKAMRLCKAEFGEFYINEGGQLRSVAERGVPAGLADFRYSNPSPPVPGSITARILSGEPVIHVADVKDDDLYRRSNPQRRALVDLGGARTFISVTLIKDRAVLGSINIYRQQVKPFSGKEIALLQNFAAQAVIAMENARLITETREALEQQTATAEVLAVINASPGDLAPVFEVVLEKALQLSGASNGALVTYDGEFFQAMASRGNAPGFDEIVRQAYRPHPIHMPVLHGERYVHVFDVTVAFPNWTGAVIGGFRTVLLVPLRKDGVLLGFLAANRREVRAFTDKEIALVENFAAQAVIAMDNARLITETREALDQQTATAEVLGVINSSPGDLAPVFDAILEKAHAICGAPLGSLVISDGTRLRWLATRGYPKEYEALMHRGLPVQGFLPFERLQSGERLVHLSDAAALPLPAPRRAALETSGIRTALFIPLRKDGRPFGYISAQRQEVRPFSDKQIALLENFAAQAVIAIENTRLITETREALEQQTATAEVLGVINSSPGDLAPVFDAMLERATRLCDAEFGTLWTFDGDRFRPAVGRGHGAAGPTTLPEGVRPAPGIPLGRLIAGENIAQVVDAAADDAFQSNPVLRSRTTALGTRTALGVALRKDDVLLGAITVNRKRVEPYSDKQIALLQNFAAQAVIAMENARLIAATREALEQQTATAEVLGVINASPGDLTPVFDAMLEKALRLSGASNGALVMFDGQLFRAVATRGNTASFDERVRQPYHPEPVHAPLLSGERFVHVSDVTRAFPDWAGAVIGGLFTVLLVPLRKEGALLGFLAANRREVRPFSDKEIALVEGFAAQAVIAIENARLITETREALEQQTATAEVLRVINSSPGNLGLVFDALLEKAIRLCDAVFGNLWTYDGEVARFAAVHGASPGFRTALTQAGPQKPELGNSLMRLVQGEPLVHIADITAEGLYQSATRRRFAEGTGARTALWVPLRKDRALLGFFTIYRTEVRPFTDKQITLLQNFAEQAVIAMENGRLMTETREALEQQTATAEVLGVINSSPGDLKPVFESMLDKAMQLCQADIGSLGTWNNNDRLRWVAAKGMPKQFGDYLEGNEVSIGPREGFYRIARGRGYIQFADISVSDFYRQKHPYTRALVDLGEARTTLSIPLVKDNAALGVLAFYRKEVRPFTDKQIALLRNFAAQAVIAMENARLLTETREALEQQTATAEVLKVISRAAFDLQHPRHVGSVRDAIVRCGYGLAVPTGWQGL